MLRLVGKHDNVAELISVFEDASYVHLILELCKGGELFDRVVAKGTFSEKMAAGMSVLMMDITADKCFLIEDKSAASAMVSSVSKGCTMHTRVNAGPGAWQSYL